MESEERYEEVKSEPAKKDTIKKPNFKTVENSDSESVDESEYELQEVQVEKSLLDLVSDEHALKVTEVVNYFKKLIKCRDALQDPFDDIQAIFDKI